MFDELLKSIQTLGIGGVFVLLVLRELRKREETKKNGNGSKSSGSEQRWGVSGPQCAIARERFDAVKDIIEDTRKQVHTRNDEVMRVLPIVTATSVTVAALVDAMDDIKENSAKTATKLEQKNRRGNGHPRG